MEIKEWAQDRSEEWQGYLDSNPNSIAWHSYDWYTLVRRHYPVRFYPLAAVSGGAICGILPLYHVKTALMKDALISVPYAVAGGAAFDSDEAANALLGRAIEISEKHNSCRITYKQYKVRLKANLQTDSHYFNRELDLGDSVSIIWDNLSQANRDSIEKASADRQELEYPAENIDLFYNMLFRHHHRRGVPCVNKKWIRSLMQFGMYRIAFLKCGGDVVAATLVKEDHKNAVSFPFTCLASDDKNYFAYSLYWTLIKRFAELGKRVFHSGRIPDSEETDGYRLGWGGNKYQYWYQYYPQTSTATEYTSKRGSKRDMLESAWKRLPRFAARVLGPAVVRQFP